VVELGDGRRSLTSLSMCALDSIISKTRAANQRRVCW
jgi:hypothetical protein